MRLIQWTRSVLSIVWYYKWSTKFSSDVLHESFRIRIFYYVIHKDPVSSSVNSNLITYKYCYLHFVYYCFFFFTSFPLTPFPLLLLPPCFCFSLCPSLSKFFSFSSRNVVLNQPADYFQTHQILRNSISRISKGYDINRISNWCHFLSWTRSRMS